MICNEIDEIKSLHAAGALHARKTTLKVHHVTKQTEQWRHMATTINNSRLASQLSIGDLGVNSPFYHKRRYTKLHNDFIRKDNEKDQEALDIPQIRAAACDKVVAFMHQAEDNSNGFNIHGLQDMHFDFLSKYSIEISGNVTRFGQDLLEKVPNYEIIKDQETRVLRKESVRVIQCLSSVIKKLD